MLSLSEILSLIGLILIICELFIGIQTGFDLVLVGTCLILGGFSGILSHNPTLALIISILLSLLYIVFGRNFIKRRFISLTKHTNVDKLIGQSGTVIRSITPTTAGLVRLDDEDWRASSDEILYEKDRCLVISLEGVTLKVTKQ